MLTPVSRSATIHSILSLAIEIQTMAALLHVDKQRVNLPAKGESNLVS